MRLLQSGMAYLPIWPSIRRELSGVRVEGYIVQQTKRRR
jgi:uncharacterized membrane protein YfbV (UPF0208 family)